MGGFLLSQRFSSAFSSWDGRFSFVSAFASFSMRASPGCHRWWAVRVQLFVRRERLCYNTVTIVFYYSFLLVLEIHIVSCFLCFKPCPDTPPQFTAYTAERRLSLSHSGWTETMMINDDQWWSMLINDDHGGNIGHESIHIMSRLFQACFSTWGALPSW